MDIAALNLILNDKQFVVYLYFFNTYQKRKKKCICYYGPVLTFSFSLGLILFLLFINLLQD